MNRRLTGDLQAIRRLLPWKKSGKNVSMKNKGVNKKKEDITKEWGFRDITPTEQERKELLARVAEIGLRVIFENFCYRFNGKMYHQSK